MTKENLLIIDQRTESNPAAVCYDEALVAIPEAKGIGLYNRFSQRVGTAKYETAAVSEMLTSQNFGGAVAKVVNVENHWFIVEVTPR